ncbi:MAG: MotA/TolQ/ExbB proton channel family protein [Phycisphaerae bacterium]
MQNAKLVWVMVLAVVALAAVAPTMLAQTTEPSTDGDEPREVTLWSTIEAGGWIGLLVILMSVASVALVVEHFISIRRERILPGTLEKSLDEQLATEQYGTAAEVCRKDDSLLAKVVEAGLSRRGGMFGFFDMQNAMQEVSEREVSRLYRKLEYLSFIAAAAPMLGLLGTVTGMIRSFNTIAATEGAAKPSDLAGGISEALVTTCMGLIVAIPSMFFVSQFRNRIDGYVAEAETIVERLMGRFREAGR